MSVSGVYFEVDDYTIAILEKNSKTKGQAATVRLLVPISVDRCAGLGNAPAVT